MRVGCCFGFGLALLCCVWWKVRRMGRMGGMGKDRRMYVLQFRLSTEGSFVMFGQCNAING